MLAINSASVKAGILTVDSWNPADDSVGVPVDSNLSIDFCCLWEKSNGSGLATIYRGDGTVFESYFFPPGELSALPPEISGTGTEIFTINPNSNFEPFTNYYVRMDSALIRRVGSTINDFAIHYDTLWNFTTGADTVAPTIISLSPADDLTGVSPSTNLVITFSEAVDVETGFIAIRRLSDDAPIHSIDVTSGLVTGSGTNTITINPSSDLDPLTGYYVEIGATAFDDPAGNSFAGIVGNSTWNFTTAALDITPPNCTVALSPLDNATTVGLNDNLVMTCDENVQAGTGNIIITHTGVGTFESIPVGDPRVSISGSTVTINPTGTFASLTDYHVTIAAGVIEDTSGNDFAGILNATDWNFTTAAGGSCSDSFHYRSSSSADNDDGMGGYNSMPDGFGGNFTWVTLSKPVGSIADDILIASVSVQNSSVNITAPVGWTLIASRNYTSGPISIKSSIYYKVAGSSEPADYTFNADSDAYSMSALLSTYNGQDFGGTPSPSFIYSINNGTYSYASPAHSYPALNSIPANDTIARFIATGPQGVTWIGSVGNLPDYTIRTTRGTMPGSRFMMLQDRDTHIANQALTSFSYSCSGPPDACGFDTNIPYITYTVAFGGGNCSGAPNPISFTPADNSTNVNIADNLTIEFDENIQKGSAGTIQIIRTSDSAVFETFAIGSGLVTVSGDTVTINPTSNLVAGVAYHVIISTGYIEDLSGNDWAGISTSSGWNFTTLDNVAPNCTVTLSPLDNATGVGLNANLVMTCNENVQAGTGNIIITHTGVGTFESIPIGDPRVTFSGSTVTINPTGTFASLTGYHVTLAAGVIEDISGNDFAGILNATDWNFTTMIASSCNGTPIFNGTHLATGVDGQYLDSADIDGDGDLDFVVSSVNDDDVLWYENDGSQNFTMWTIDSNLDQPGNVKISDVDQDGDLDLVAAGRGDDVIVWYRNDGSENFTKLIIDASINGSDSVDVSDIDGDGDLDIVGSATIDDIINWYENDGSENFTKRNVVPFLNGVGYVKAVDFDGDGDEDVVATAFHADEVNWYENDGSQNFTEHNIGGGNGPYYSEVIDFDGDGDLDVVTPIYFDGEVVWFENDGSFSFTKNVIATGISGGYAVKVDNLDKDGDLDVVVTNLLAGTVNWLENDGSLNFTIHSFGTPSISSSRSIEAVYFDGNDAIDIVIVSTGTDALTSFEAANCIGGSLPVITNLNPLDNATGVSDSTNLVMSFSENVIADSGNILIRLMSDNSIVESIPVGDPRVTGTGTNTITVNPSVTLAPSTAYYVEVGTTAFEDLSGNSFAGITGNSIWNFTVFNPFAIDMLSVTPLKNRLNVGVDLALSLKFSNPVFIGSGDLRVYETVGNVLVDTIPAGSARVYGAGLNTIYIYPINGLNFNTHYYITMDSGFLNGGSVIQPVNAVLPGEWFFRTRRSAAEAPTF